MFPRRKTHPVKVGNVFVGGAADIAIQSMTKTDTWNIDATVAQIHELEKAGCHIIRCAVPQEKDARALKHIKEQINIPLVADIHFSFKLALIALESGVDKLRLNPGNIGGREKVQTVVKAAKERGVPIRIGVNSGSLEKELLEKYGKPTPEAIVESAMTHVRILEDLDFHDIIISLKSTELPITLASYKLMSTMVEYPFHIGLTESGLPRTGSIKSAAAMGALLADGIGDTMRISLTTDPVEEIRVAQDILKAFELKKDGVDLIACPTCGRCEIEMIPLTEEIEKRIREIKTPLKVAVMGCVVNGPGEAKEADVGLAGGGGVGLIFRKGQIVKKVPEKDMLEALLEEIYKAEAEMRSKDA